jgi:hypothetical protein
MAKVGLKRMSGAQIRYKALLWCFSLVVAMTLLSPLSAVCAPERLIDSSDYKDKDFIKGCISDYSDMVKGDDIDWVWISPGTVLAQNRIAVGKFENTSDELRSTQFEGVKTTFKEILSKVKGEGKGMLTADICIYEYQKFSPGKAWIPFVGGHQMQAGMGVEMILRDKGGKTVAKLRDMARSGTTPEEAADESATNLKKYINKH